MATPYFDIIVGGAGLSGIGMACHLTQECPTKSFAVIERRDDIGGTWDLFRYPGIRSDSDMFTFGYDFRPWHDLSVLADGTSIKNYIRDTAKEFSVYDHIQFSTSIAHADWSTQEQVWTLTLEDKQTKQQRKVQCQFFIPCTGYYNHAEGHRPSFPNEESFKGQIVHPQFWPNDLDYKNKKVVVIGSGATAVTLVPAMAEDCASITMLQRSPSYVFSVPAFDALSKWLGYIMPKKWVFNLARKRNIFLQRALYKVSKRFPNAMRRFFLWTVKKQVGDKVDMKHFSPYYNPWDQRLCAVPDGDLFETLSSGQAHIVTDTIKTFDDTGIQLDSGEHLDADIIITATGLSVQVLGGMTLSKDEQAQTFSDHMTYKSVLVEDVPNFAYIFGYTNAPWTLKADLASRYVCRLINYMDENQLQSVYPHPEAGQKTEATVMDEMQSGYIQRAKNVLPKQGKEQPWRVLNKYEIDKKILLKQPIEDSPLVFGRIGTEHITNQKEKVAAETS